MTVNLRTSDCRNMCFHKVLNLLYDSIASKIELVLIVTKRNFIILHIA
jgi:hypothetical protein